MTATTPKPRRSVPRRPAGLLTSALLVAAGLAAIPTAPDAPLASPASDVATDTPGEYIVTFKPGATALGTKVKQILAARHGVLQRRFTNAAPGFAATFSARDAALVRQHPDVAAVEPNRTVTTAATVTQTGAAWGLARISSIALNPNAKYTYDTKQAGAGVHVYVVDTGLYAGNVEFQGRIGNGVNTTGSAGTDDRNGHGTMAAGIIGGTAYGVAKKVTIHPVKALNDMGSGSITSAINGLNWVAANAKLPAVVNLSFTGAYSPAIEAAATNLVFHGITVVAAAGNESKDSCSTTGQGYMWRTAPVILVGATDNKDNLATFSNTGACLDVLAPGFAITSAFIGNPTAVATWEGTSMSTAFVSGAAAMYLTNHPNATPAQVSAAITQQATAGIIKGKLAGTPNRLLHTGRFATLP